MATGLGNAVQAPELQRAAATVGGTFELAFFEVETIRDTAARFETQAARLHDITEPKADRTDEPAFYGGFLDHTGRAAAAAEAAAGSLADRAFQAALVSVAGALREIDECAIELSSISFLTKITQSEAPAASDQVAVFVKTLDTRLADLKCSSTVSSALIAAIQRQSGLARDELSAIARDFRSIARRGESRRDRLDDLEAAHHAHIAAVRTSAGALGSGVGRAVRDLVGCLQFPDAFAQRVDHVGAAMARHVEGAEADAVAVVIAAQLRALSRDLAAETGKASGALHALRETLDGDIAIGSEDGLDPSSAWIDANGRTNEAMLGTVSSGRAKLRRTLGLLSDLVAQIDRAQSTLRESSRHNQNLETSVHNALIVASKSENTSSPLRFLADCVKDVVGRSSRLIGRIDAALSHIRATSEALEGTGLDTELESLAAIQEAASARSSTIASMMDDLREARDGLRAHSARLSASSAAALQAFCTASDHAPDFERMAQGIETPPAGAAPLRDVAWLYQSYTMEIERDIHRAALGLPEIEESASDDEDEFDDFLI